LGCSGISCTICKQSAPRARQITTPTPHRSIFTCRMLFPTPNQQCQSKEGNTHKTTKLNTHVARLSFSSCRLSLSSVYKRLFVCPSHGPMDKHVTSHCEARSKSHEKTAHLRSYKLNFNSNHRKVIGQDPICAS